jgi:hypothetical protein
VVQGGGSFSFSLETAKGLGIVGQLVRKKLQGDKPAELHILGLEDHAHPTAAKLFDDAVVRDSLADH